MSARGLRSRLRSRESGQGLMLAVMAVTLISTSIALFTLSWSQKTFQTSVEHRRMVDVIYALNGAAAWLRQQYVESNCDPHYLNIRVNRLPSRVYRSELRSQALNTDNTIPRYAVAIGRISANFWGAGAVPPAAQEVPSPVGSAAAAGVDTYAFGAGSIGPQDVSVTIWANPFLATQTELVGGTRIEQIVTLVNTCSVGQQVAQPRYGTQGNVAALAAGIAAVVPGTNVANSVCGARGRGSVDATAADISPSDRFAFQGMIRNGDTVGAGVTNTGCADMNNDTILNEVDLNIQEKLLKGYLYFVPPSWES